ncbi:MAG: chloride channel protein [Clostridia bacterium]|nr:chloride channel protein [Clostridia bacterium]
MNGTKAHRTSYMKNILLPGLVLSGAAGFFTGILIFIFKYAANYVFKLSDKIYEAARLNPLGIVWLALGAAVVGLLAELILHFFPVLRGGGIPTAIAVLRGITPIKWAANVFLLFISALLTFLCGIPLGNEGPSVQMGTAMGKGTVQAFAKKHSAWERYIMTGGACAGFAAATSAPLSGILFAFEEAHRRFSPMIFITSACSVITGTAVSYDLCRITNTKFSLFELANVEKMPLKYAWCALIIGVACGLAAAIFTKCYRAVGKFLSTKLRRIPFFVKTACIFVSVAVIGYFMPLALGTGHHLADELLEGHGVWYVLILAFIIRAMLLFIANNSGITGGLFVPTLAFGAIIGALCAIPLTRMGALPEELFTVAVAVGMTSFMSASARTPLMSIAFAIEALSGLQNAIPVILGAAIAYITVETLGITAFTDTVVEKKAERAHRGKTAIVIEAEMTVGNDAFAAGKEIHDVLWPPSCSILSVHREGVKHISPALEAGDVLHLHFSTYDKEQTVAQLFSILGEQEMTVLSENTVDESISVPEL